MCIEGNIVKTQDSTKVNKSLLLALCAVLVSMATLSTALLSQKAQADEPQRKGRMSADRTIGIQPEHYTADQQTVESNTLEIAGKKLLRFDTAENAKRFVFDETPLFEDGSPAYANEFITEGYIYEPGTLDGTNGVNEDGSPEFPDKVIGRWICRGWHVGDGAKTVTGPWVVTHQVFDFGAKPDEKMLTTDGLELVDVNVPIKRAIIGGTGEFIKARGEATQTMLGFNQLGGVNLRFEVEVIKK